MSAPFVSQLRASRNPIELAEPGAGTITFRVQAAELWDSVRVVARPDTPVADVKRSVVSRFFPNEHVEDFVLKLRGWEMLDEREPLMSAGVQDGATILLSFRRRRPVR